MRPRGGTERGAGLAPLGETAAFLLGRGQGTKVSESSHTAQVACSEFRALLVLGCSVFSCMRPQTCVPVISPGSSVGGPGTLLPVAV